MPYKSKEAKAAYQREWERRRRLTDPEWHAAQIAKSLARERRRRLTDPEWRAAKIAKSAAGHRIKKQKQLMTALLSLPSALAEITKNKKDTHT